MKLTVGKYDAEQDFNHCTDEHGVVHYVDLVTDGPVILDGEKASPKALVGQTVEIDYLQPYVEIAHNVRVVGQ